MIVFNIKRDGNLYEFGINEDGTGLFRRGLGGVWNQEFGTSQFKVSTFNRSYDSIVKSAKAKYKRMTEDKE